MAKKVYHPFAKRSLSDDVRRVSFSIKFGDGQNCLFDAGKILATVNPPTQFLYPQTSCFTGKNCEINQSDCVLKTCSDDYVCQTVTKYRKNRGISTSEVSTINVEIKISFFKLPKNACKSCEPYLSGGRVFSWLLGLVAT